MKAKDGNGGPEKVRSLLDVTARVAAATAIGVLASATAPVFFGGPIAVELLKAGLAGLVSAGCAELLTYLPHDRLADSTGRSAEAAHEALLDQLSNL